MNAAVVRPISEEKVRGTDFFASLLLDLTRQQRNLLLLRPLFQLELSKNRFGDEEGADSSLFEGIDTHYLVLMALDYMMEGVTVAMGFTEAEVANHLAKITCAMKPALTERQSQRVAQI